MYKQIKNNKDYFYPKISPDDGLINFSESMDFLCNFIRSKTKPYPGAFIKNKLGKKIKIWSARPFPISDLIFTKNYKIGQLIFETDKNAIILCGDGAIEITNPSKNKILKYFKK